MRFLARSAALLAAAALFGCADESTAPVTITPEARLVNAVVELNQAAAAAHAGGFRVILTLETPDAKAPKVGVLLLPR